MSETATALDDDDTPTPDPAPEPTPDPPENTAEAPAPETAPVEAAWPDDWLDKLSKGDDKRTNVLKRYSSPEAVADALISAQNRIRSGELKSVLPEKATEEQLTAWRKENGIPEKPEDYDLKFDSGLVVGKDDEPFINDFLQSAHATNQTPEQVKSTVEWWYSYQQKMAEDTAEKDQNFAQEAQDTFYAEHGSDTRKVFNMIESVLTMFPEDVRDDVKSARLPNGKPIFSDVGVLRTFSAIAHQLNPAGIVTPSGGGDILGDVNQRLEEIKGWMSAPKKSADWKKYWENDKVRQEYTELLGHRDKLSK